MGRKAIELRIQDFLGTASDQRLDNPPPAETRLPFAVDLRRHPRPPAQRLPNNERFLFGRRSRWARRLQANVAISTTRRIGLAKVTQDRLLSAFARVGEVDHHF